jgi:hypothetical protein
MSLKRGLALLAALLALFLGIRESREPYLWLFIDDLLHPKPPPLALPLSKDREVRLYAGTRPHTGKVARLQKGLVLVVGGQERIEEGFGFGLPLVEVGGQAYLSRSASVELAGNTLRKHYQMDTIDTPSGFLRRKYEPVPSIGTVVVSYTVTAGTIEVAVDLSGLQAAWDRVFMMNEQGARFFTRYEEPGMSVEGDAFGKWQPTTAAQGCIVAHDRSVRFCVRTPEPITRYYGRERYLQYYWVGMYSLSWAGIDLELEPPLSAFEYDILVEGSARD